MRVLRVTNAFPPRHCGWSHHVWYLSRAQAEAGHEVRVIQPEPGASGVDRAAGGLEVLDVEQELCRHRRGSRRWRLQWVLAARRAVHRELRVWKPDLLHVHGDAWDLLTVPRHAWCRPATLLTIHSGLPRTRRYRVLAPSAFRRVDGIIAVSPAILGQLAQLSSLPGRAIVLSSGVDCRFFAPPTSEQRRSARAAYGIHDDTPVVVGVARLVPMKAVHDFVSAVAAAAVSLGRLHAFVAGDGPERPQLEAMIRSTRAPVTLMGELERGQVREALWSADAFLLTSVDLMGQGEGSPTAVIEAMASGLPVVATTVGGIPPLLLNGRAGSLVPPGEPRLIAEALVKLLRSPGVADAYRTQGHLVAEERSWDRVAQRVTALAEEVCAARRPAWPA